MYTVDAKDMFMQPNEFTFKYLDLRYAFSIILNGMAMNVFL